jgi:hypothetical protein
VIAIDFPGKLCKRMDQSRPTPTRGTRPAAKAIAALGLVLLLAGCYFPVRFDAEIEITRAGFYNLTFQGYVADVQLFDKLARRDITPAEEAAWVMKVENDIKRDVNVNDLAYMNRGLFRLGWKRSGDLLKEKMITFLRRNEPMLSVRYVSTTGRITVEGTIIASNRAEQLRAIGLTMDGQLRVRTDGRVAEHNATRTERAGGMAVYVWDIKGLTGKAPKLIVDLR